MSFKDKIPDKGSTREFAHQKGTKAPEGAVTGAGTGGAIDGVLGWLVGIGLVAIPEPVQLPPGPLWLP